MQKLRSPQLSVRAGLVPSHAKFSNHFHFHNTIADNTQKNFRSEMRKKLLLALSIAVLDLSLFMPGALAALESDDTGMYGSVTIQRDASSAAKALKTSDWVQAQSLYKKLIGSNTETDDFYFGLYFSSYKLQQWDQVALALEGLFRIKSSYKDQLMFEYGECLFHLNRYDEAEPILKKALLPANLNQSVVETRVKRLIDKSIVDKVPVPGEVRIWVPPKVFVRPERIETRPEDVSEDTKAALNYKNAFMKSEKIVVATYKGYEPPKGGQVSYYKPPKAIFHIEEELKGGGALNPTLPIRYEFHSKVKEEVKPANWKFSDALMPEPGSKWIIFIENAVANSEGSYDTFHGAYGRQEYTTENIDAVMRLREEHKGQAAQ